MGSRGYNPNSNCPSQGKTEVTTNQNYTSRFGGTSGACPQAAGVAALLMSYVSQSNFRTMSLDDYKAVLKLSSDDLGDSGWDSDYGYGRLNAMKALVAIGRGDPNKDSDITLADVITISNYVFYGTPITPHVGLGDANCNGSVSLGDTIFLVNWIYQKPGWQTPPICYEYNY